MKLLETMDDYERGQLSDNIKEETYNEGEFIVKEGDHGDIFFFIVEGEAIALKTNMAQKQEIVM